MIGYSLLKALHLLSVVLWVGGMFFAIVILRPSLSVLEGPQRLALHERVFKRFFLVVWHAMPIAILTGYAIIGMYHGGMANVRWPIHVMSLLGLVMGAVFALIWFVPYRRFRAATAAPDRAAAVDSMRKLITLNLILGLVTVVIATIR